MPVGAPPGSRNQISGVIAKGIPDVLKISREMVDVTIDGEPTADRKRDGTMRVGTSTGPGSSPPSPTPKGPPGPGRQHRTDLSRRRRSLREGRTENDHHQPSRCHRPHARDDEPNGIRRRHHQDPCPQRQAIARLRHAPAMGRSRIAREPNTIPAGRKVTANSTHRPPPHHDRRCHPRNDRHSPHRRLRDSERLRVSRS